MALVRRERVSLFVELSALLYIGVLSVVGGLVVTFRDYVESLGDAAILAILTLLMVLAFGYCFARTKPYSSDEVASPSLVFDYVLYFGCLIFSAALAFIETRFGVFGGWDTHLLIAALVFGILAYRFDNRFVLSLALSSLAGFIGLRLSLFDDLDTDYLRLMAISYGALLLGLEYCCIDRASSVTSSAPTFNLARMRFCWRRPREFSSLAPAWPTGALLLLSAASIYLGVRYRRFAFVAYGTLYGYFGLSVRLLWSMRSLIGGLFYFVVTGALVVIALVVVARRFGRDE